MKVLIIPDVHLKPEIFDQAMTIMENSDVEMAVCVGDIADDWYHENDVKLYESSLRNTRRHSGATATTTLLICGISMNTRGSRKKHRTSSASISKSWMPRATLR